MLGVLGINLCEDMLRMLCTDTADRTHIRSFSASYKTCLKICVTYK